MFPLRILFPPERSRKKHANKCQHVRLGLQCAICEECSVMKPIQNSGNHQFLPPTFFRFHFFSPFLPVPSSIAHPRHPVLRPLNNRPRQPRGSIPPPCLCKIGGKCQIADGYIGTLDLSTKKYCKILATKRSRTSDFLIIPLESISQ